MKDLKVTVLLNFLTKKLNKIIHNSSKIHKKSTQKNYKRENYIKNLKNYKILTA